MTLVAASAEFKEELIKAIPDMRRFARSFLRSAQECDDLVQETIIKALDLADTYTTGTRIKPWLYTIQKGLVSNEKRKSKVRAEYLKSMRESEEAQLPDQFEYLLMEDLRELMAKLPIDQRAALYLVCHDGRSYAEAAEILEVSVGTVKSRVSRARAELAEALDNRHKGTERQALPELRM